MHPFKNRICNYGDGIELIVNVKLITFTHNINLITRSQIVMQHRIRLHNYH